MHFFTRTIATALLAVSTVGTAWAQAGEPLVVIRFNQRYVHYEQQLYKAMQQAVAIKPELMVDVVSYSPETGDSDLNEQWQQAASVHTQKVVATLQQMGVPRSRIAVTGQRLNGIKTDETHIFVR